MIGLTDINAVELAPLKKSYSIAGKKITLEAGKLGILANGAVTMSDEL